MRTKLIKQGLILTFLTVALFSLTLLAVDGWMNVGIGGALPQRCLLQFPKWYGCAIANHETLAGAMIATTGALFAGWLAWRAAIKTIENQRRPAEKARSVIVAELMPAISMLNQVWRVVEAHYDSAEERSNAVILVRSITPDWRYFSTLKEHIEQYKALLEPHNARLLVDLITNIDGITHHVESKEADHAMHLWLKTIQLKLTYLDRALAAIDIDAAKQFDGRKRAQLNEQSGGEQIGPLVDEFLSTGRLS